MISSLIKKQQTKPKPIPLTKTLLKAFSTQTNFDTIIIGAGSIGVPTAMELQEAGLKVLVLDKRASPGQGDNKCAIGGIRATHSNASKILSGLRSLKIFSQWKEKHGFEIEWKKGGYLFPVYREAEEKALKSILPIQQSFGMEIDFVSADRVKELVPGINENGLRGGTWSPNDGSASPMLSSLGFYKYATELGAQFHFKEEVIEFIRDSHGALTGVKTALGTYHAPIIIDAAGAASPKLMKQIGLNLPVEPDSHEAGITEPTEKFFSPMVVDMRPGKGSKNYYFYQNIHGQVIFCITPDPAIKGLDREETSVFLPQVSKRIIDLLPRLANVRVRRTWRGLYPMTPDGNPLLGWNKEVKGLFTATGMCGQGYMLGPGYATAIRSAITKKEMSKDDNTILSAADPHRTFQGTEIFK
ncbi:fad-binding oxidoreductase [Anaeramoeba ignava]|uniref:FAD-dependent oxidoreductase domain-containing protein 1 n=1 Tax=Anaeramoeba ignava TaxID=1746090 RepID=A0A9Q0LVV4_ANAIG|nr:fad-binding oxidoreductase [Anaeramoeba ignava]